MPSPRNASRRRSGPAARPGKRSGARRWWEKLNDAALLDVRLCDLDVSWEGTWLERPVARVLDNLQRRRLRCRPHFWVSEEWFSPGDVPGIAIPFYLVHPRLMSLERKMMLEVEGGTLAECLMILRHEAGHAVQHGYQLQRRRTWSRTFGRSSEPYPEVYEPKPRSKRYVQHLSFWYAQSHPDEDFAETFAVWLGGPPALWRQRYAGWPALKKLEYVDRLMAEIADVRPEITSRARLDSLPTLRKTLRTYYEEKQRRYGRRYPDIWDPDLMGLFSAPSDDPRRELASTFLRRVRREVRDMVCRWTGEYAFTLDQVFNDMIGRCRELRLRVAGPERQVKTDFAILLTVHTMNTLHNGRFTHTL